MLLLPKALYESGFFEGILRSGKTICQIIIIFPPNYFGIFTFFRYDAVCNSASAAASAAASHSSAEDLRPQALGHKSNVEHRFRGVPAGM